MNPAHLRSSRGTGLGSIFLSSHVVVLTWEARRAQVQEEEPCRAASSVGRGPQEADPRERVTGHLGPVQGQSSLSGDLGCYPTPALMTPA